MNEREPTILPASVKEGGPITIPAYRTVVFRIEGQEYECQVHPGRIKEFREYYESFGKPVEWRGEKNKL